MITEDYVSFETAKLLKERGFDKYPIFPCYKEDDSKLFIDIPTTLDTINYHFIPAPTLQMAMKWLRAVHKLGVFPTTFYREMGGKVKHDYGSTIVRLDTFEVIGNKNFEDYTFAADTYEETAEKTIKYCLENLI